MYEEIDPETRAKVAEYDRQYHEKADKKHPDMEDRYCWKCGQRLVKDSMAYHEGFHFDSCY